MGIAKPFTDAARLKSTDHRLYVLVQGSRLLGMLKVGQKHLYYWNEKGATSELDPLCVLDFYVHESCQRKGLGRTLFDAVVEREGVDAAHLAYDRPSAKMMPFLAKNYGLRITCSSRTTSSYLRRILRSAGDA